MPKKERLEIGQSKNNEYVQYYRNSGARETGIKERGLKKGGRKGGQEPVLNKWLAWC